MNSRENHEPMSDPFDVWLQSCPEADVPEGLRARCLATIPESQQTEDAVRSAPTVEAAASPTKPGTVPLQQRKRTMFRIARYGSIAAAAAVVGVVAGYFLLVHPTASVTFAQVIENVTKAESIRFVFRQKLGSQPVMVSRMCLMGSGLRCDLVDVEGVRELKELRESGQLPVILTLIGDTSRKEALQLDHFRKTATKTPIAAEMAAEMGSPVEQLRHLKGEDAELIGLERQGGRTVQVYRLTRLDFMGVKARDPKGGDEMKVWVDAKTGWPVRIRVEGALSQTGNDHSFLEWEEFVWNAPVDPALFSLEIPEGYTVKEPRQGASIEEMDPAAD